MKTNTSLVSAMRILLTLSGLTGSLQASPSLLTDLSLAGVTERVQWTNLSNTNSAWNVTTRTLAHNPETSTATGIATVQAPAFAASAGVYSFSGDYSITFSTDPTNAPTHAVLQVSAGLNTAYSPSEYLIASGGPVLSYLTTGLDAGTLPATSSVVLSGPVNLTTTFGSVDFYVLVWEWDLTGLGGTLSQLSIQAPAFVHTNLTGAQLDLSNTFVSVIPETSSAVLCIGSAALTFTLVRRRKA